MGVWAACAWLAAGCVVQGRAPCTADDECTGFAERCDNFQCRVPPGCADCAPRFDFAEGACEPAADGHFACALHCDEGYVDQDGAHLNGCEYACRVRGDGTELCNGQDDDCDGETDEGFDLDADPAHCGACGVECPVPEPHADRYRAICRARRCLVGCAPGLFGAACDESSCRVTNGGVEVCDGVDNDCNGEVDEPFDRMSDPAHCGAGCVDCRALFPNATGYCDDGTCVAGPGDAADGRGAREPANGGRSAAGAGAPLAVLAAGNSRETQP